MGIFSNIMDKIFHHSRPAPAPGQQQTQYAPGTGQQGAAPKPISNVDVEAVLSQMAKAKGGGGNYRESIVDLLKLLDLDSSLAARKAPPAA